MQVICYLQKSLFLMLHFMLQLGIGLLVLQQLCGINSILFYSNAIFGHAG